MKRKLAGILTAIMVLSSNTVINVSAENNVIAFPGAEGGGMYATGGRGCPVYIVDTLADYDPDTEEPIKGSLRDAVSEDNRMIVFNVSGVIELKDALRITKRKNLTIAGQTAPGNGITVYGYETNLSNSENIIIRYMRFRAGSKNVHEGDSMDAIWGRSMKNVMIDHISTSWSTDETMSLYRAENMTVQWSIISESLTMSGHTKGRHGYGAIWGGVNTTYHHNLIANHTSRNPRFGGGTAEADDNDHIAQFDVRNNVIYNWGFNTAYGGGRSKVNYVFNYVKAGNGTRADVVNQLVDCGEENKPGWFYINGNYMEGNAQVSEDNSKGVYVSEKSAPFTTISSTPFQVEGVNSITTDTPQEAYNKVLAMSGATYPKRDAVDARVINQVRSNTGTFINLESQVGGLPYTEEIKRADDFDKDRDGIADSWELENGLSPSKSEDALALSKDGSGYTNIEKYINSLVDMEYSPENPEIEITSIKNNEIFNEKDIIQLEASVTSENSIKEVQFYSDDKIIGTVTTEPYKFTVENFKAGTYHFSAKAIDVNDLQTQATAVTVHINSLVDSGEWLSTDIGKPNISGHTSVENNTVTVKGAGKLKENKDTCHFAYQILVGDGEITAKIDNMTPIDNHAFAGLMIRESVGSDAKTVVVGLSHTKPYQWKEKNPLTGKETTYYRNAFSAYMAARAEKGGNIDELSENLDSLEAAKKSGVQLINDIEFKNLDKFNGYYLKLNRTGNVFTAYISSDGENWTYLGKKEVKMSEKVYMGMAVDSNKVNNNIDNLNTVEFSNVKFTGDNSANVKEVK